MRMNQPTKVVVSRLPVRNNFCAKICTRLQNSFNKMFDEVKEVEVSDGTN